MVSEPSSAPPYLDWQLDRWKIGLVLVLFAGLVIASLSNNGNSPARLDLPEVAVASDLSVQTEREAAPVSSPAAAAETPSDSDVVLPPSALPEHPTSVVMPLIITSLGPNAIVPDDSVRAIFGTADPGAIVEVRDQFVAYVANSDLSPGGAVERVLGAGVVDEEGLWQVGPFGALRPGQHVLIVHELDPRGEIVKVSTPVVVTVLSDGEQGPLSLATPMVRYPTVGLRVPPGALTFLGTGLPGVTIRVFVDNRVVAEGLVNTREEWRLVAEDGFAPGVYVARAVAVNPQGDIIAESAPVVFHVEVERSPRQGNLPLSTPTLPLTVSGLAFSDRRRQALVVRGWATPHTGVELWLDGSPVKVTNALVNGSWAIWLTDRRQFEEASDFELRSSFGERVATNFERQPPVVMQSFVTPILLTPQDGQVLTTRRPMVTGLAEPASDVAVMVNNRTVARVRADGRGQFAFKLVDPLPSGATALSLAIDYAVQGGYQSPPIFVSVAPKL